MVTLTDKQLAEIIGKDTNTQARVYWQYEDLPEIKIALRALRMTSPDNSFLVDGVMPYWLYLTILAALAPKKVQFNTPNFGAVEIPANSPEGTGSGLAFRTYEHEQFTLVQFLSPRTMQAEGLSSIVPPVVNPNKGVIISSSAPFWIIGTVALAYASKVRWTACTQKLGGPIVAISNDKAVALGTEIDKQLVEDVINKAAATAVPKRGEIWLFDSGYGEHPGLIISPDERNQNSSDVLVVPFSSSTTHSKRHLVADPAKTGLAGSSYAQYSNISKMSKEHLIAGPLGHASNDFITEIVRHIRLAIGDAA